jgi:RNA ligase
LFKYKKDWILATRGSFTSDQAVRGMEIIKAKYDLNKFEHTVAYLVEIIYPENLIVVSYGEEKITFLSLVLNRSWKWNENKEGNELHWTNATIYFHMSGIAKEDFVDTTIHFRGKGKFGMDLYKDLKSRNTKNKEGFVLRFFPSNYRCKIKFEDYIALHRIVTQVSSYDIWENLRDHGKLPESFLSNAPDEFYDWVRGVETEVNSNFKFSKSLHSAHVSSILRSGLDDRKIMAEAFMKIRDERVNFAVLFLIADGKDPDRKIWDMVKPKYSRPTSIKKF